MGEFAPTDEQAEAVRLAMTGGHLAINAGAGAGKSSTLRMIAMAKDAAGIRNGTYTAFNRRVITDASGTFPRGMTCATAHGLAMKAVGRAYRHRLGGRRMKSADIARHAGIDPMYLDTPFGRKRLAPGFLAGILMRSTNRFAQSADPEPTWRHIVTPNTMRDDRDLMRQWDAIRRRLEPSLVKAWADLCDPDGVLPFSHDAYLKIWSLSDPVLNTDYLLCDESQDLWPSWLAVVEAQRDRCQIVLVGDQDQMLYAWRGATNAMEETVVEHRAVLSRSFRFGPEIADVANGILGMIGSPMRMTGGGPPGRVGSIDFPDMVLCRTNAAAVREALEELDGGGNPHIVGGADDVVSFARGAMSLQEDGYSYHPDLACFNSWAEVVEYAAMDEMGHELGLLVKLVEDFTAERIVGSFGDMPPIGDASLITSTVHKMKGGEAASVKLAGDFPVETLERPLSDEDLRVGYVAVTRAMRELDPFAVEWIRPGYRRVPLALPTGTVGR
jgi:hypothetical protein